VEEIVFVNTAPAFGLHFYTGSEIERVPLAFLDLEKQLREEKTRLWLVLQNETELFREELAVHYAWMQELGPISGRENYFLFKEIAGKIKQ
jgi:hypothetical protein